MVTFKRILRFFHITTLFVEKLAIRPRCFNHFKNGLFLTFESECTTAVPKALIVGDVIVCAEFAYKKFISGRGIHYSVPINVNWIK